MLLVQLPRQKKSKKKKLAALFAHFLFVFFPPLNSTQEHVDIRVMVRGSDPQRYAQASDAEAPSLQTRPRPRVSSDRRGSPPPPCLFLRGYSESAPRRTPEPPPHRRTKRRPSAAAAAPGRDLTHGLPSSGSLPGASPQSRSPWRC